MGIITKMRKQIAVYWELSGLDEFGKKNFLAPVEVPCRWEDVSEAFQNTEGETVMSNSKAYPDRDIILGSIMMLGELTDITDAVNITENAGAYEVRKFEKMPNLRNTKVLRTAIM